MDNNDKYLNLITSEYYNSENFKSFVRTFLDMLSPIVNGFESYDTKFNINNAEGDQLDIIGTLVGVSRVLEIQDPDIPPVLDDDQFRFLIKAKIEMNHYDGTNEGLINFLSKFFSNSSWIYNDDQDMGITISLVDPNIDATLQALIVNGFVIPKPAGVKINYNISNDPLFGWDDQNVLYDGWDLGKWGVS